MTKPTSSTMKAATTAKKKTRSVTPVTKILLYGTVFVGCVSFSSAGASFIPFVYRATTLQCTPQPRDWIMFFDVVFI
jgi:hypothetical protein